MKRVAKTNVLILFIGLVFLFTAKDSDAFEAERNGYFLYLDAPTIQKGYTLGSLNGDIRLGITPGVLTEASEVEIKTCKIDEDSRETAKITSLNINYLNIPQDKRLISDVHEFDIKNKKGFSSKIPLALEIKYFEDRGKLKEIYFLDSRKGIWRTLPSRSDYERGKVRAFIHLPYAKIAVLEDKNIMEVGEAGWYRYKGCNCAASCDWPKGTYLRVTNVENGKSVIVKVNDYGPERNVHLGRIIDLDSVAFKKIGRLSKGLIKVKVEVCE